MRVRFGIRIDHYDIDLHATTDPITGIKAIIGLYGDGSPVGAVHFHTGDVPPSAVEDGRVRMPMAYADFDRVVDLLRNEGPHVIVMLMDGRAALRTAELEPVGEGER